MTTTPLLALDGDGPLYPPGLPRIAVGDPGAPAAAGARLPSTRALAADLGISRNVVLLAYEHLLGEGYAQARTGSGTVVAPTLPEEWSACRAAADRPGRNGSTPASHSRGRRAAAAIVAHRSARRRDRARDTGTVGRSRERCPYDFRFGRPAFGDFPHAVWGRLLGRPRARSEQTRSRLRTARGLDASCASSSQQRLRRYRGVDAAPEQIVVVNGSQQALDLVRACSHRLPATECSSKSLTIWVRDGCSSPPAPSSSELPSTRTESGFPTIALGARRVWRT
jgi:GntR family transcriptional regulator/MocR family aminotransferase